MIVILQERTGKIHLVQYSLYVGSYTTMCSRIFKKRDIFNTLAIDASIDVSCTECSHIFKRFYQDDLDNYIRNFRSSLQDSLVMAYVDISSKYDFIQMKYWFLDERHSQKVVRIRQKIQKRTAKYFSFKPTK